MASGHLVTGVFCWQTCSPSPRDKMWAGFELRAGRSSFTFRLCKFGVAIWSWSLMLPLQHRAPGSRCLCHRRCPAWLEPPLPRQQVPQKVSLVFTPQVMFFFSSIVTGEEDTVVLVRGGGRSRGGWTTLSRSGKIQAGTTLTQILLDLIVTVHEAPESEGARSRCDGAFSLSAGLV